MDLFDIAVAKKLSGGGGGGGAVHRTYEGTMANIMTMLPNYSAFVTKLGKGTAFARITAALGADSATLTVVSVNGLNAQASLLFLSTAFGIKGFRNYIAKWNQDKSLNAFELINATDDKAWSSTNYAPMASQVLCTLEVVEIYSE